MLFLEEHQVSRGTVVVIIIIIINNVVIIIIIINTIRFSANIIIPPYDQYGNRKM